MPVVMLAAVSGFAAVMVRLQPTDAMDTRNTIPRIFTVVEQFITASY
jgi:hypothetical protein